MANKKLIPSETDSRVVQHHIRRGAMTQAEWQTHLDSLPDEADEALETETRFSPSYEQRHYVDQAGENAAPTPE